MEQAGDDAATSTGLAPRLAAVLAYGGWWVTGLLFWWLERRNAYVRFHAAQSVAAFGTMAALIAGFGGMAAISLAVLPSAFALFVWAAGLTWVAAIFLCAAAMWAAATGRDWRMPLAGRLADGLAAFTSRRSSPPAPD
jgi:uncharacterized membrane protein